jgi:hypothetical protein
MPLGRPAAALLSVALTSCFPPGDGLEPPPEEIYFPVGLAIDVPTNSLFVANSDFDLQYNQGVLQRYDLERLRETVPRPCVADADCGAEQRCDTEPSDVNGQRPSYFCVDRSGPYAGKPCGPFPESSVSARVIAPGRCGPVNPSKPQDGGTRLITSTVQIGAFATDALFRSRPPDAAAGPPGRVFVPVRGDTTLHYVEVDAEGNLECGQRNAEGRCDDEHRVGDDPEEENTRDLRMPANPYAISANRDGRIVVVTHQTQGQVSLFVNDWSAPPRLEFIAGGLPSRPMEMASLPVPRIAAEAPLNYQPGFLLTFRNSAEVRLMRFFDDGLFSDAGSIPARPYLADVGAGLITTNTVGTDSRGIAIDDSDRAQVEADCETLIDEQARLNCWYEASGVPLHVFVANRTPPSLVLGRTRPEIGATSSSDIPTFYRTLPLTAGPSRVVTGNIINRAGEPESRVFVICFDSRLIFVYDPITDRIETEIFTGRGPHPLALDQEHGLGYIGHFTDSYIGVIALDQRYPKSFGTIIATIGTPTAPRATK